MWSLKRVSFLISYVRLFDKIRNLLDLIQTKNRDVILGPLEPGTHRLLARASAGNDMGEGSGDSHGAPAAEAWVTVEAW